MVEMGMGEKDVMDALQGCQRQIAHARAGIHQGVIVQQEAGGAVLGLYAAGAAQDLNAHMLYGV